MLSPCTDLDEMTPRAIVQAALRAGLDMIAICDHNSARNVSATVRAARNTSLVVIPGIEVTSSEEVHVVALFPDEEAAAGMQEEIYSRLRGQNDENVFGYQVVVDEFDMVEDLDQRLLIGATTLSTERVVDLVHRFRGLAIASHVDRKGFGIFSQLGFIPAGLRLDGLEISRHTDESELRKRFPECGDRPLITSSDAHYLRDVGSARTIARLAEPTLPELSKALMRTDGRNVLELKRSEIES